MKIMLIGGAGFIGSAIVESILSDTRDELLIIDNLTTGYKKSFFDSMRIKFIKEDLRSKKRLMEIFKQYKPDIVNYQAGITELSSHNSNLLSRIEKDIYGVGVLLECCREYGCKKFIFASSGDELYGNQECPHATWVLPEPVSMNGAIKAASESLIKFYNNCYDLNYAILRYTYVYGHKRHSARTHCLINDAIKFGSVELSGDGTQTRDFVYLADVVSANFMAMRQSSFGVYNVGTGIKTSYNDVIDIIEKHVEKKIKRKYLKDTRSKIQHSIVDENEFANCRWDPIVNLDSGIQTVIEKYRND